MTKTKKSYYNVVIELHLNALNLNEIKDNIDLIYLQNLKDTPHLFKQAIPFFLDKFTAELDRGFFFNGKNKYLLILNWGEGTTST